MSGDGEGRMRARSRPLLYDVAFVALQLRSAFEDAGGGVFFEVAEGDWVGEDEALVAWLGGG